jgi:hypothetical protein
VFVDDGDQLAFAMLPVPTSNDVLAILDLSAAVSSIAKRKHESLAAKPRRARSVRTTMRPSQARVERL